ncbi:MAG: serine hydrolase [Pyrinomonadaceae bacterium]
MVGRICFFLLFALVSQAVFAQDSASTNADVSGRILERIQKAQIGFSGKVWIYAKNLDTGAEFGLRQDERVRTASTIKLPIMAETFRQVSEGKLRWDQKITLTKDKKVGGSGILHEFSDDTVIDLRTAVHLMIVVSDNTATNLVLDLVGSDNVNANAKRLGLDQTLSLRKVFGGGDSSALKADETLKMFGLGVSSPRDMARLLEMIENGKVVSKEASAEMIGILKRQQFKDGIGRNLPDTIESASKSGALDRLRSDVGILYTRKGRLVIAITVDDMSEVTYTADNPGLHMIWKISQILQDEM